MTGPRRLLLTSLVILLVIFIIRAHLNTLWVGPRVGVDTESTLLAADRWLAGGLPYNASGFTNGWGIKQPFLYPPYTLPFLAVLAALPRQFVLWTVMLLYIAISVASCRRLRIPWAWIPLVLLWPPFAEGILACNVGIPLFGAFIFLFYRPGGERWRPAPRDIGAGDVSAGSDVMVATLATIQGAIKTSQPHAWLFVLRHRPRAAVFGSVALVILAAATLFLTGIDIWFDWLAQVRLAGDLTWDLGGIAVPRFLPPGVGYLVVAACILAVWFVPRRDPAPSLGVLSVIGTLSLHTFGMLFLLPAMLVIRRELALIAALFITTYSYEGAWAGIVLVAASLAAVMFGGERVAPLVSEAAVPSPMPAL